MCVCVCVCVCNLPSMSQYFQVPSLETVAALGNKEQQVREEQTARERAREREGSSPCGVTAEGQGDH